MLIEGKTAEEWEQMAKDARQRSRDSFDRSDTDGFVSQWASDTMACVYDLNADIIKHDGWEFDALFDLQGNLVPAKYIETRFGWAWALLNPDNPEGPFIGFFNESKAENVDTARINNAKKGYYLGRIRTQNVKADLSGSGTGLSGAMSVHAYVKRTDGGFSADVQIIDNGIGFCTECHSPAEYRSARNIPGMSLHTVLLCAACASNDIANPLHTVTKIASITDVIEMPGPVNATVHQILSARAMLKIEIRTGLQHSRGSVMNRVNEWLGTNHKKKRNAYDALNEFIANQFGPDFDKPRTEWDR